MRILAVSNYYPPHFIGGYELGCRDILERLGRRGHQVLVLTSTHGVSGVTNECAELGVWRQLRFEDGGPAYHPRRYWREFSNRQAFRSAIRSFSPDLVYFWNQSGLPGSLVRLARMAGLPYVFYLSDDLFLNWRVDSLWQRWFNPGSTRPLKRWMKALTKTLLESFSLTDNDQHTLYRPRQFTSHYIQGLVADRYSSPLDRIIPWGVDTDFFPFRTKVSARPSRMLYVGQLEPHKGTLTALQAIAMLLKEADNRDLTLTIVGGGVTPDYLMQLHAFVATENLTQQIRFEGKVERQRLPNIYQNHDILIFPSVWEEPFAITPLEAMSSGLVVVGTATGGSKEIFVHGRNSLVFAPYDAAACAKMIRTLLTDGALYRSLREEAKRIVQKAYSIDAMVDSVEEHLTQIAAKFP